MHIRGILIDLLGWIHNWLLSGPTMHRKETWPRSLDLHSQSISKALVLLVVHVGENKKKRKEKERNFLSHSLKGLQLTYPKIGDCYCVNQFLPEV